MTKARIGLAGIILLMVAFGIWVALPKQNGTGSSAVRAAVASKSLPRSDVEAWFAALFSAAKPVNFHSDHGVRLCCEYPNIAIEFRPDRTAEIATDGWAPKRHVVSYSVGEDGRISLEPRGPDPHQAAGSEIKQLYLVTDGSDVYLVQDLRSPPDFKNNVDHTWPLKFIESGDWLPAVKR